MVLELTEMDRAHFWVKVQKRGWCWLWTGHVLTDGYGQFSVGRDGRTHHWRAHRLSYELLRGPIPDGLQVLHRCDTPLCVNPEHLRLGTHQDNMRDMEFKSRQARGERIASSRLTAERVREMRRARAEGATYRQLANRFNVTMGTVANTLARRTWKHVA